MEYLDGKFASFGVLFCSISLPVQSYSLTKVRLHTEAENWYETKVI